VKVKKNNGDRGSKKILSSYISNKHLVLWKNRTRLILIILYSTEHPT